MRILFLLLFLLSCAEEEVKQSSCSCKTCLSMTISDSIPIQFWVNGQETFNEKQICGVYNACFCHPFECDDEITIQVQEIAGSDLTLVIYDSSEQEITTLDFDEVSNGVYQLTFTPSEISPSICEKVRFKINAVTYSNILENPTFVNSDDWTNSSLALADWSVVADKATVVLGSLISSEYFYQSQSGVAGQYRLRVKANITEAGGSDASVTIYVDFITGGIGGTTVVSQLVCNLFTSPDDSFDGYVTVTVPSNFDTIAISASQAGPASATATVFVDHFYAELIANEYAFSDGIDLKESHECTEVLAYTNTTNFDGIVYETSPPPTFYLRIPAQFWKENNPMTQEDSELSNGVIVTRRQTIQEKILLEIGYVPNWLHKKIQKILMHETVSVSGQTIKRRDEYEAENLNRYPLKRGTVWLTKYDSVEKNTI